MLFSPFNDKISKKILFLSKPVIFSNLSRSMMGIVDMIMIGGLGSTYVAAAGMGSNLFWFAIAGGGFSLMSAVQTITARRLGQGVYTECSAVLYNGLLIGLIYSIVTTGLCTYYVREIVEDEQNLMPDGTLVFNREDITDKIISEAYGINFNRKEYIKEVPIEIYPDTTVWIRDFKYSYNGIKLIPENAPPLKSLFSPNDSRDPHNTFISSESLSIWQNRLATSLV